MVAVIAGLTVFILKPWKPREAETLVRVADQSGESIPRAGILVMLENELPATHYSDSNGIASFNLILQSGKMDVRLIVESPQHQIFDRNFELPTKEAIDVKLLEPNPESGSVVIRVVNDQTGRTITNAEIVLIVEGNIYRNATDSFGITKFLLPFPDGKVDSRISVELDDFKTNDQRITLLPNRVQDVRLDPVERTIEVVPSSQELFDIRAGNISVLPDGEYFFGSSQKADEAGGLYMVIQKKGSMAAGYRYIWASSDSHCFAGKVDKGSMEGVMGFGYSERVGVGSSTEFISEYVINPTVMDLGNSLAMLHQLDTNLIPNRESIFNEMIPCKEEVGFPGS